MKYHVHVSSFYRAVAKVRQNSQLAGQRKLVINNLIFATSHHYALAESFCV